VAFFPYVRKDHYQLMLEMMTTFAPSPYLAAHISKWAAFCTLGIPRAAFCGARRERLLSLPLQSINQRTRPNVDFQ